MTRHVRLVLPRSPCAAVVVGGMAVPCGGGGVGWVGGSGKWKDKSEQRQDQSMGSAITPPQSSSIRKPQGAAWRIF